jgi:FAD:protein FMN transferase
VSSYATASLRALGTSALVVTSDATALPAARRVLVAHLRAFDLACSRFRDDSELVALNRAAGRSVRVSPLLWEALVVALRAVGESGGLVDPTVGRSLRLVGYDRTLVRLRRRDGRFVGTPGVPAGRASEIQLDPAHRTVRLPPGVELDLGATAKAFAADRIAAAVAAALDCGVVVSLGGDVAIAGAAPAGGWPIGVAEDHRQTTGETTIALASGGVATSSTMLRRWQTRRGERHHIVDPRTGGSPPAVWRTVTVVAASCVAANTASTASIVLGEAGPGFLEARGLPARLVRESGSLVHTEAWPLDLERSA